MLLLILLLAIIATYFLLNSLKQYIRQRRFILSLPGPKSHILLGHALEISCDDTLIFKKGRAWAREYYPIYNLSGLGCYSVNIVSAEDFQLVASTYDNTEKSIFYEFFDLWLGKGLFTSKGSAWQKMRKILTPAFHWGILQQFLPIFNDETKKLVNILKNECHNSQINLMPYITQSSLCMLNEATMGYKLDLTNQDDKDYCSALHEIIKNIYYRAVRPWWYSNTLFYTLSPTGYKEKGLVKILHGFTNKIIKERSENFKYSEVIDNEKCDYFKGKKMAMLDILLSAKVNNDVDDKQIQDEVNTFMFGGHDSVTMGICFTLLLLASHKDVQELIFQEINKVLGDQIRLLYINLQELKYMERCIKESLRIYPPGSLVSRILKKDVLSSNGYVLPKGALVNIHIYDVHRDPKVWPNPEKFDPDRFLPEECQNRHPFSYVPFSAGARNCIGQKYAILAMKAVLCGILRNFILEPVDTPDNIVLVQYAILTAQKGIVRVKLTPRVKSSF